MPDGGSAPSHPARQTSDAAPNSDRAKNPAAWAIDTFDVGTWELDPVTNSLHWSERARALLGVGPEANEDWNLAWSLIHPDDRELIPAAVARAIDPDGDGVYQVDFRIVHPDGRVVWVDSRAKTVFEATPTGRRAVRLHGAMLDITARKSAEAAVRASEEKYRRLFESIDEGFATIEIVLDHQGRPRDYVFLETNPVFEQLTGLAQAVGKTALQLVPSLEDFWIQTYGNVALTGRAIRFESYSAPMGRWFDVHASRFGGADSRTVALVFTNISERKQAEEALRESEKRFRNMADHAPMMVWITDATGRCSFLSQSWYDFTGQTPATGLGFGWLDAVHSDDSERSGQIFLAANQQHAPFRLEYRLRRHDGEYRWAIDSAHPRFGEHGEFLGYIGSVIDITERKHAEAEQARLYAAELAARVEAETALQTRDQFLSIASHELRTPLTSLMGYAYMLRRATTQGKRDTGRLTEIIIQQAQRLNALIGQLLDVSRLQQGQFTIELNPVDLGMIVADVMEEFRATLPPENTHTIELCSADEPIVVEGDALRLEQVLYNLLNNAVKYSPNGGLVRVRVAGSDAEAVVEVADQGIGIASDAQQRIFEPFFRADNAKLEASSFGLGLHVVREIVQRHGGRVEVDSGEGIGSTFRVTLPRRALPV